MTKCSVLSLVTGELQVIDLDSYEPEFNASLDDQGIASATYEFIKGLAGYGDLPDEQIVIYVNDNEWERSGSGIIEIRGRIRLINTKTRQNTYIKIGAVEYPADVDLEADGRLKAAIATVKFLVGWADVPNQDLKIISGGHDFIGDLQQMSLDSSEL